MSKITITGLSISYGDTTAVDAVSLSIPERKITALVGPSGCGKSTFLSSLNRLSDLVPHCHVAGDITMDDGTNLRCPKIDLMALRRRIGMVFQRPNPFPQSIRRNFSIPLREHGFEKAVIEERMETALRDVGLWEEVCDRLHQNAQQLSGGQQQRLCIARALALDPEVILFDEPCSALDPLASGLVEDHIAALSDRLTVVIVTHNLAQAKRIADHVAVFWMRNGAGTIVEAGETGAVFQQARDPDAIHYLSGIRG